MTCFVQMHTWTLSFRICIESMGKRNEATRTEAENSYIITIYTKCFSVSVAVALMAICNSFAVIIGRRETMKYMNYSCKNVRNNHNDNTIMSAPHRKSGPPFSNSMEYRAKKEGSKNRSNAPSPIVFPYLLAAMCNQIFPLSWMRSAERKSNIKIEAISPSQ